MLSRTSNFAALLLVALTAASAAACGSDPSAPPQAAPPLPPDPPPPVVMAAPDAGAADPSGFPAEWPYKSPVAVRSPKGMVVTDAALGTAVGRDILAAGGNAADAAVATAFALAVVFPTAGNIGGGGFMVIQHCTTGSPRLPSTTERQRPAESFKRDMYLGQEGQLQSTRQHSMASKAAGIPGTVAGLALSSTPEVRLEEAPLEAHVMAARDQARQKKALPLDQATAKDYVDQRIKKGATSLQASPGGGEGDLPARTENPSTGHRLDLHQGACAGARPWR